MGLRVIYLHEPLWGSVIIVVVMKSVGALLACVLAAAASSANGLFFYVVEGQQRCFIEEVPADTLVIGKYKNPDFKPYGDPGFTETVSHGQSGF